MRISQQLARRRWLMHEIGRLTRAHKKVPARYRNELVALTTAACKREVRWDRQVAAAERRGQEFARDMGLG